MIDLILKIYCLFRRRMPWIPRKITRLLQYRHFTQTNSNDTVLYLHNIKNYHNDTSSFLNVKCIFFKNVSTALQFILTIQKNMNNYRSLQLKNDSYFCYCFFTPVLKYLFFLLSKVFFFFKRIK